MPAKLRDALAIYVANAERIGGRKSTGRAASGNGRKQVGDVREWARANGHTVNDRGRIPADIQAATTRRTPEPGRGAHPRAPWLTFCEADEPGTG